MKLGIILLLAVILTAPIYAEKIKHPQILTNSYIGNISNTTDMSTLCVLQTEQSYIEFLKSHNILCIPTKYPNKYQCNKSKKELYSVTKIVDGDNILPNMIMATTRVTSHSLQPTSRSVIPDNIKSNAAHFISACRNYNTPIQSTNSEEPSVIEPDIDDAVVVPSQQNFNYGDDNIVATANSVNRYNIFMIVGGLFLGSVIVILLCTVYPTTKAEKPIVSNQFSNSSSSSESDVNLQDVSNDNASNDEQSEDEQSDDGQPDGLQEASDNDQPTSSVQKTSDSDDQQYELVQTDDSDNL
jgi:hypothetical protein